MTDHSIRLTYDQLKAVETTLRSRVETVSEHLAESEGRAVLKAEHRLLKAEYRHLKAAHREVVAKLDKLCA
jgi:hypothetical protein